MNRFLRRHRTRVIGALVALGAVLALAINPRPGRSGDIRERGGRPDDPDRFELLDDGSFALQLGATPWTGVFQLVKAAGAGGGTAAQLADGAIRQNVDFAATDRSYRLSARVRSAPASASAAGTAAKGVLRIMTRCDRPESTVTAFTAEDEWIEVSATLDPLRPQGCSLGVELEAAGGAPLQVDRMSLVDANLFNASFERGQQPTDPRSGWRIGNEPGTTAFAIVASPTAVDGGGVGRLAVEKKSGSVAHDFVLDPSSEQIRATFSVALRAVAGDAAASVAVWVLCDKGENDVKPVKLTRAWQVVTASVVPKAKLLRVEKPPCTVRVEVYNDQPGSAVELDAAQLVLETARPPRSRRP